MMHSNLPVSCFVHYIYADVMQVFMGHFGGVLRCQHTGRDKSSRVLYFRMLNMQIDLKLVFSNCSACNKILRYVVCGGDIACST